LRAAMVVDDERNEATRRDNRDDYYSSWQNRLWRAPTRCPSPHSNQPRRRAPAFPAFSPITHSHPYTHYTARKSIGPETQQDRKLDSGDQRREDGRNAGRPAAWQEWPQRPACVRRMLSRAATNRRPNLRLDGKCQRCIKRALKRAPTDAK